MAKSEGAVAARNTVKRRIDFYKRQLSRSDVPEDTKTLYRSRMAQAAVLLEQRIEEAPYET